MIFDFILMIVVEYGRMTVLTWAGRSPITAVRCVTLGSFANDDLGAHQAIGNSKVVGTALRSNRRLHGYQKRGVVDS